METISSLHNPKVRSWRSLKERKGRDVLHAFLVEGSKMVAEALSSDFTVDALLVRENDPPAFSSDPSIPVYALTENVFQSVCDTKTPQGIAAVVHMGSRQVTGKMILALDGIQDPGNMGTLIRTADAAGFTGIMLSTDCVDVFSPKVLRATMGSIFRMGLSFPSSLADTLAELRDSGGFSIISSQLDGDPFFERDHISPPLVLIVGNEGNGISETVRKTATHRYSLPMRGGAESLNAAVAAGIMMYDLTR